MLSLWIVAGNVGHALAAALLASLAILTSRRSGRTRDGQVLVVALTLTALWSLRHALGGVLSMSVLPDGISETVRNAAWLAVLAISMERGPLAGSIRRGRPLVFMALSLSLLVQIGFDLLVGEGARITAASLPVFETSWLLRATFAIGALLLLHDLSGLREHPAEARQQAWVGAALAFMWAYDFNHYMLAWLTDGNMASVAPMRGLVMALFSVMLVLGLRTDGTRALRLSRAAAMRLVSLGIIALYLLVVVLLATLSRDVMGPAGRVFQFAVLFALAVSVLALLPSASLRSWLRVVVSKHLFAHRYDYRVLWLRYAATVAESDEAPLEAKLTRAIGEAIQAPGAALFLSEEEGGLREAGRWSWPEHVALPAQLDPALSARLEKTGWIIDIAADWQTFGALLPGWMQSSPYAWVLAPLIHREQLVGAILLASPPGERRVDWEDLDVLRVVCA